MTQINNSTQSDITVQRRQNPACVLPDWWCHHNCIMMSVDDVMTNVTDQVCYNADYVLTHYWCLTLWCHNLAWVRTWWCHSLHVVMFMMSTDHIEVPPYGRPFSQRSRDLVNQWQLGGDDSFLLPRETEGDAKNNKEESQQGHHNEEFWKSFTLAWATTDCLSASHWIRVSNSCLIQASLSQSNPFKPMKTNYHHHSSKQPVMKSEAVCSESHTHQCSSHQSFCFSPF